MASERNPRRRWRQLLALGAVLVGLAVLAWLVRAGGVQSGPPTPAAAVRQSQPPTAQATATRPAAPPLDRAARRRQLAEQVQLADLTYCSYLQASAYPHGARPVSEQPDQIWPNAPVTDMQPMREEGGDSNPRIQIQSSQSRVYVGAGESVQLALRALDEQGHPLALTVTGAVAQGLSFGPARAAPQVTLAFHEGGAAGEGTLQEGAHGALFTPSQTALAGFEGTIRIRVRYSVDGKAGALLFDVIHTPQAPAVWTGQVREALEDGSLNFYLKLDVRQAGRYVVHGRVDDARGRPLALLTFNELLAAGPGEVRLGMFGKLVRDHTPAMPLTLRDVDGYLLRENADPDRAILPRLPGRVHTSRHHPIKQFSDAEWQSPERSRYLDELGRDMRRARAALIEFDPAAAPGPPCRSK